MSITSSTFFWQHKSFFSRDYILIQDEIPVGELHQHGWWNKQAIAVWDTERWDCSRQGIFKRTVSVSHNTVPIGEYGENFWGNSGKLVLGDGSTFVLKRTSFWGNNVGWYTLEDQPILRFKSKGFWGNKVYIELTPDLVPDAILRTLMVTGWFLQILRWQDQSNSHSSHVS